MKRLVFIGSSLDDLRAMPALVRHTMGVELMRVQLGGEPLDFKPMPAVGAGAYEIRVREADGAWRTIYVAKFGRRSMCCIPFKRKRRRPRSRISTLPRVATD